MKLFDDLLKVMIKYYSIWDATMERLNLKQALSREEYSTLDDTYHIMIDFLTNPALSGKYFCPLDWEPTRFLGELGYNHSTSLERLPFPFAP